MTYSNDLNKKIIDNIRSKKYTDIEMINFFNISRGTFYKIKKIWTRNLSIVINGNPKLLLP